MNIRGALAAGTVRLADSSDTPRLDAEVLMAHALGIEREMLLLSDLELRAPAAFEPLLARRAGGEPVAYITGRRAFWTIELEVGPGALVPRPDSETLIAAAAKRFGIAGPKTVLDLGTGSGAIALAIKKTRPDAAVEATDFTLATVPAIAFFLWYNDIRFGSPFESGRKLGRFGAEAAHAYLVKSPSWANIMAWRGTEAASSLHALVEQHFPAIGQELAGLAEGLELPTEDVFLWNCRGDLWAMAPDGCSCGSRRWRALAPGHSCGSASRPG